MAGNFLKYAGPLTPNDLPVDAHELVALCAPRPVFISSGSLQVEGGWIDGKGMFLGGVGPVRFTNCWEKDLGTNRLSPMETALIDGDIAFRQHAAGPHRGAQLADFPPTFASRYFNGTTPEIALTFDDLPSHGMLPPGMTRADVANSIIHALQSGARAADLWLREREPISKEPESEQVLKLCRCRPSPLGSHAFTHWTSTRIPPKLFEQDVVANEPILQKYMAANDNDKDWHWCRYPLLTKGTPRKSTGPLRLFLKQRSYRVAQVDGQFNDYAYNEPYVRCLAKAQINRESSKEASYLKARLESLFEAQKQSNLIYGRDIRHILLIQVGSFENRHVSLAARSS